MKITISSIVVAVLLTLGLQSAGAQSIIGYNKVAVPALTDVLVSVPFTPDAAGAFAVATKTATGVTVTATLSSGLYANAYYVRFTSGAAAGRWTTISANGTGSVDFADLSFLSSISVGDGFSIYPHQTLNSLFPAGMESLSFTKSTSASVHTFEVLFPDTVNAGINKAPITTYYYRNSAWRQYGQPSTTDYGSTVLPPQTGFVLRNLNTSTALTYVCQGNVPVAAASRSLATSAAPNDIPVVSNRPAKITLTQLDLGGTAAFLTSTSHITPDGDQLLLYDNHATGKNKAPTTTYYFYSGSWRLVGDNYRTLHDNDLIDAGAFMLIRKAGGTPGTATWTQVAPY